MRNVLMLAGLGIAGCATTTTTKPAWVVAATPAFEAREGGFSVAVPQGWMRVNQDEFLVITRDGPGLQRILVGRFKLGDPLPNTKKVISAEMLPQEVAEVVADDLVSAGGATGAQVLENAPARLAGIDGFRLVAAYRDGTGLRRKVVLYGAVQAPWLYRLGYVAPARHYFDLDLATFEDVVKSFRLTPAAPGAAPAKNSPAASGRAGLSPDDVMREGEQEFVHEPSAARHRRTCVPRVRPDDQEAKSRGMTASVAGTGRQGTGGTRAMRSQPSTATKA